MFNDERIMKNDFDEKREKRRELIEETECNQPGRRSGGRGNEHYHVRGN